MNAFPQPETCRFCRQDLVRECSSVHSAKSCLIATIHKFVLLADMAGFSCEDLLGLLTKGLTPVEILELMILQTTTTGEVA